MNSLTVGGCKIPVTHNIQSNLKEIKEAIDWASENGVQLMSTPECALSGYLWEPDDLLPGKDPKTKELEIAMEEVISYSKEKNVDLILGTAWYNKTGDWTNMQRYIFKGEVVYEYAKNILADADAQIYSRERLPPRIINYNGVNISGVICNDFWSNPVIYGGASGQILGYLMNNNVQIVFVSSFVPKEPGPENSFYHWHLGQISNMSLYCQFATVVSDSSTNVDGTEYNGPPAAPVGIWDMNGISTTGEKYFKKTFI